MRRQEFNVILIGNERSNIFELNSYPHTTSDDDDNFKRIEQFVDPTYRFRGPNRKLFCRWTVHLRFLDRNGKHRWVCQKWRYTTDVSWWDRSHHVISIRATIRCNINVFDNNINIKPVPKLANRFAESLQSWKRRATVKSSQYNIHGTWIMFLLAHAL